MMKCPVCGAVYRPPKENKEIREDVKIASVSISTSLTCRRCKADLSDLIRLHDQAIWHHKQALNLFSQGYYPEAAAHNHSAISLNYCHADFHTLAGKLSALQGKFPEAIASWQQALKFDRQNAIARNCLQMIELMAKNAIE